MHPFRCTRCQTPVFFENDHCAHCGATLGFVPGLRQMAAFDSQAITGTSPAPTAWPPAPGVSGPALRPCGNRVQHGVCNWMLDDGDGQPLCRSCRLTRLIPPLDSGRNLARWALIERAKRRLVFTLLSLGLAPEPKTGPGDRLGLDFHLLEAQDGAAPVKTGHDDGTITLNVAEADDDAREALRVQLGEPSRTLLGHLRHETAHWLQYRWIATSDEMAERCRAVFGDERADYSAALQRHYAEGPPADWPQRFVSAYASAHPWEDWAETCAHYLLVLDAVQTAAAWGLQLTGGPADTTPDALALDQAPAMADLVLRQWLPVAQFLNAMNRSLGLHDSYPFLLPPAVLAKLSAVQALLPRAQQSDALIRR